MSFLRLLTNPKVMGDEFLQPSDALHVYREFLSDGRVRFAHEPPNLERTWMSFMIRPAASGSAWTDGYLAAFAVGAQLQLVSFYQGLQRWLASSMILGLP